MVTKHTNHKYTSNKISDSLVEKKQVLAGVSFHGDSVRQLRGFPDRAKHDLGYALYRLQLGQIPPDRKVVRAVGVGVYELREEDAKTWYRILYIRRADRIHVLHCFEKRSNSIEQKDIETARARLKRVLEAETQEEGKCQASTPQKVNTE